MLLKNVNYKIKTLPFNHVMRSTLYFYKVSPVLGLHLYSCSSVLFLMAKKHILAQFPHIYIIMRIRDPIIHNVSNMLRHNYKERKQGEGKVLQIFPIFENVLSSVSDTQNFSCKFNFIAKIIDILISQV